MIDDKAVRSCRPRHVGKPHFDLPARPLLAQDESRPEAKKCPVRGQRRTRPPRWQARVTGHGSMERLRGTIFPKTPAQEAMGRSTNSASISLQRAQRRLREYSDLGDTREGS